MIRVRGLTKVYHTGKVAVHALRGVDLDLGAGEFAAVVGPSGCGKSTLLYVIGGMLRATRGTVEVDGFDVTASSDGRLAGYRRETVGFVFQKFNLIGSLTVLDNLRIACRIAGRRNDDARHLALLESVGLADKRGMRPLELSQGEQQRVAIARALAKEPRLLLADEPTGNLDSENSRTIMALFRRIAGERGPGILMITHNEACAAAADRTIRLQDGRTVGAPSEREESGPGVVLASSVGEGRA
jgi:putative ABC transport system ATP-binding protein